MANVYIALRAKLTKEAQKRLRYSQKTWLRYWPKLCTHPSEVKSKKSLDLSCSIGQYRSRIKELSKVELIDKYTQYTLYYYSAVSVPADLKDFSNSPYAIHKVKIPQLIVKGHSASYASLGNKINVWLRDFNDLKVLKEDESQTEYIVRLSKLSKLWRADVSDCAMGIGAAHEMDIFYVDWFNEAEQRRLKSEDVFRRKGWNKKLAQLAEPLLRSELEGMYYAEFGDLAKLVSKTMSWEFTAKAFVIHFNVYEVAPYVAGPQSVSLSWKAIAPLLSTSFKMLYAHP